MDGVLIREVRGGRQWSSEHQRNTRANTRISSVGPVSEEATRARRGMGAECSQPCDEDDGSTPLDAWRAFGLIDFPERDDEDDTDIDCVRPGIFLGGMEGAMNVRDLQQRGITHVLCAASYDKNPKCYHPGVFQYLILGAADLPDQNMAQFFTKSNAFISGARHQGGSVYVHCYAGVSRAPTLVLAYLMKEHGLSLGEAMSVCMQARPQVRPNIGFMRQLDAYAATLEADKETGSILGAAPVGTGTDQPRNPLASAQEPAFVSGGPNLNENYQDSYQDISLDTRGGGYVKNGVLRVQRSAVLLLYVCMYACLHV